MSGLRAVTADDLPAIAELLARVSSDASDVERLERQLALVLFEHPWPDPTVPSLLAEDDTGKVQAFLGVMPRPMRLGDRAIRAAVAFRLTIHPECREFVGTRLLRRFLGGSQDLSLLDGARCAIRGVWERLGGFAALPYTLSWTRPLRPAAWAVARLAPRLGPVARLARSAARIVDGPLVRASASPFRLPDGRRQGREVGDDELLGCMEQVSRRHLRAAYDAPALRWVLARATERVGAPLTRVVVEGRNGAVRGWYVLAARRGGVAHVMQMASAPDPEAADLVLCEILRHASAHGALVVRGRMGPRFTLDLTDRGALLHASSTWMLAHAREAALIRHIERGEALLDRLDGDSWLPL